ncbi:hypothetical protein AMECASPLE_009209 [Ameca splendens]|uniref:Uncharacterized protein n=1 Tax=Ameca splendens TaxID=208324 RepID=A0ABV0YM72_9TELE
MLRRWLHILSLVLLRIFPVERELFLSTITWCSLKMAGVSHKILIERKVNQDEYDHHGYKGQEKLDFL